MISLWHSLLGMEKHDEAWHRRDILEEVQEYKEARRFMEKWSELSDIVYTYTRGKWSGHVRLESPLSPGHFVFGLIYMFPKYTLRWLFFRVAGARAGANRTIREVRNPAKAHKLDDIAERNGCDRESFRSVCAKQLRYWPLLK